ncbi:MAG TPA: hypothetical protein VKG45_14520 [Actinomycetes bacterium]|nr:hypothetical protein [Actinomycetes bacterium]
MTVRRIFWASPYGGRDLHLLPGLASPRLDYLLIVEDTEGRSFWAAGPPEGVTVSFTAAFAGTPAAHGVAVDAATGEVRVDDGPLPPPRLRSFVVQAEVTSTFRDTHGEEAQQSWTARVRVHVHDAIERLWLTPPSLTVREGATNMRFTVLARFADGSFGDLTNWCPSTADNLHAGVFVHARDSADPELAWSASSPDGSAGLEETADGEPVGERTSVLRCTAGGGAGATVTVHRPLPPSTATQATAEVHCQQPWSSGVRVNHLAGAGFAAMADPGVRNVLFLPDGFEAADRATFERCVRRLVARLSHRRRTRPFDLLKDRFNYFQAWVASPQAGISVLDELDRVQEGADSPAGDGVPVPLPRPPDPAAAKWSLAELIDQVGLPTPADDPDGSPLDAPREAAWQALHGPAVTIGRAQDAYPQWLALNDRALVNERDTAFHTAKSSRPTLTPDRGEFSIGLHPLRLDDDDLEAFLTALQDDHGRPLAEERKVWTRQGKDRDLVVILCRTGHKGGTNNPRVNDEGLGHYACVALDQEEEHHLVDAAGGTGFDVRVQPVPSDLVPLVWLAAAHELSHSLTLEDEYGGPGILTPEGADDLAGGANVQLRSEVDFGSGLDAEAIAWRWPRIAAAGVLRAVIERPPAETDPFRLRLEPGHARSFRNGDVVRVRTRPVATAVGSSDPLTVTVDGDDLIATPRMGSRLDTGRYPAGSVVLLPLREPEPEPFELGADLELVARSVRERIGDTRRPLDAASDRPCVPPQDPLAWRAPTPPLDFAAAAPRPPRWSVWIVGLYEQGGGFGCGVYRPTGICLMRLQLREPAVAGFEGAVEFCPVCRYAIVDLVDPTRHPALDRDYARRYPA